jgi:hypothetical protein
MALSLGQVFVDTMYLDQPLPLYIGFPVIAVASTIITIVVSLMTQPTDIETLKNFYRKVQPAGAWRPAKDALMAEEPGFKKQSPFALDLFNTVVSMIGIISLYVSMLYLILHRLNTAFALIATTIVSVIILYFTWYKNLPPPSEPPSEDVENMLEQRNELLSEELA